MQELGVDLADADALFALLHDGSGGVTRAEFVSGITKLRGEARASDLLPVVSNMQRILGHVKSLRTSLDSLLMEKEAVRDQTQVFERRLPGTKKFLKTTKQCNIFKLSYICFLEAALCTW